MTVSIITVVYNNCRFIGDAIRSVLSQDYPDVQYIVVDGGSDDGTVDIVRSFGKRIHKFVSEPDKGIYDAMNKGIALADGEYVGILNSDDIYQHENVLTRVMNTLKKRKTDTVYGNLVYVKSNNPDRVVRYWRAGSYRRGMFLQGWMPPHPTFFVKKEVYDRFGTFNLKIGSVADYELMLRYLHRYEVSTAWLDEIIVRMRMGGQSNASLLQRLKANQNDRKAWSAAGLKPRFYTMWMKPARKIPQYLRRIGNHTGNYHFITPGDTK